MAGELDLFIPAVVAAVISLILWVVSLCWGYYVVARRAGRIARAETEQWWASKSADPVLDRVAGRAVDMLEPRISAIVSTKLAELRQDMPKVEFSQEEFEDNLGRALTKMQVESLESISKTKADIEERVTMVHQSIKGMIGKARAVEAQAADQLAEAGVDSFAQAMQGLPYGDQMKIRYLRSVSQWAGKEDADPLRQEAGFLAQSILHQFMSTGEIPDLGSLFGGKGRVMLQRAGGAGPPARGTSASHMPRPGL